MAATGLLALLDDITTILDDVAAMSKLAVKKTAGIAGDDLAVGSHQLIGIDPKRELPVVWAVAKGSLFNKAWLVPSALALSLAAPWAITPILMAGGAYLCYEGLEKVLHKNGAKDEEHHKGLTAAVLKSAEDLKIFEKDKIKQAVRTDAILSAEIVAVTLGAVAASPFLTQAAVLSVVAVGMTVAIYGLVGGIVKMDDAGVHLLQKEGDGSFSKFQRGLGNALVKGSPVILKTLSIVGTAAMFMVGGGIIVHGIPGGEALFSSVAGAVTSSGFLQGAIELAAVTLAGVVTGVACFAGAKVAEKPFARLKTLVAKKKSEDTTGCGACAVSPAASPLPQKTIAVDLNAEAKRQEPPKEKVPAPDNKPARHDAPGP